MFLKPRFPSVALDCVIAGSALIYALILEERVIIGTVRESEPETVCFGRFSFLKIVRRREANKWLSGSTF